MAAARRNRLSPSRSTALVGHELVEEHRAGGVALVPVDRADHVVGAQLPAEAFDHHHVVAAERLRVARSGDVDRVARIVDDCDVLDHLDAVAVERGDAAARLAGRAAFEHASEPRFVLLRAARGGGGRTGQDEGGTGENRGKSLHGPSPTAMGRWTLGGEPRLTVKAARAQAIGGWLAPEATSGSCA